MPAAVGYYHVELHLSMLAVLAKAMKEIGKLLAWQAVLLRQLFGSNSIQQKFAVELFIIFCKPLY